MATAYCFSGHIQAVCRLLRSDGSRWTRTLYAQDAAGDALQDSLSPQAVKWSLAGAESKVLYESFGTQILMRAQFIQILPHILKRQQAILNLYFKAGLPRIVQSHPSTALIHFGNLNDWDGVERLLRRAYVLAKEIGR
jgi:hypothetical protein